MNKHMQTMQAATAAAAFLLHMQDMYPLLKPHLLYQVVQCWAMQPTARAALQQQQQLTWLQLPLWLLSRWLAAVSTLLTPLRMLWLDRLLL
jgi:hypothetical protein